MTIELGEISIKAIIKIQKVQNIIQLFIRLLGNMDMKILNMKY